MTVRCPQCSTRYRLPPRSRLGRNPTYRCTRCRHVFAPDEEAEAPTLDEPDDDPVVDVDDEDDAPVFTVESAARDPEPDEEEPRRGSRRAQSDVPVAGSPARFAARAALAILIVYGIVSIYVYTHAATVRALLAGIPLVGGEVSDTRLHPGHIQLADVHGEFKRVHGDRLVFVITGTAINNAPVSVAGIQIQGRITGSEERRQVVYCGAAPQDVGELGIREIELLQTLKPPGDWSLPPGEQDRFLVAFVDPPLPLTEFTAEVVSVRGGTRRPDTFATSRP